MEEHKRVGYDIGFCPHYANGDAENPNDLLQTTVLTKYWEEEIIGDEN